MNAALIQNDNLFCPQYVYEMMRNSFPTWRIDNIIPFAFSKVGSANNFATQVDTTRSIYVGWTTLSSGNQAFQSTLYDNEGNACLTIGADATAAPIDHFSDHASGYIQFAVYSLAEGDTLNFVGWKVDLQVNSGVPVPGDSFTLSFKEAYADIEDFTEINLVPISGIFSNDATTVVGILGGTQIVNITLPKKTYSLGVIADDYLFSMNVGGVTVSNVIDNGTTYTVELSITAAGTDVLTIEELGLQLSRKYSFAGGVLDVCLEVASFIYIDKNYNEIDTGAAVSDVSVVSQPTTAIYVVRDDDNRIFPIATNGVPRSIVGIFTSQECV